MKTMALLFAAMLISFGLCACDDGDNGPKKISTDVIKAFEQRYPQAVQVDWDRDGRYYVAEFKAPYGEATGIISPALYEMEAWFDAGANWKMTVMELTYDLLPDEVKGGFSTCRYSQWRVEDADIIERNGKSTVYALEVKQGKEERCLYFNARGELSKEMKKDSDDYRDLL